MDVKYSSPKLPIELFAILIKFVTLRDVLVKIMWLNREVRDLVREENYTLFKHFLRLFSMNRWQKRGLVPVNVDIASLIRENCLIATCTEE